MSPSRLLARANGLFVVWVLLGSALAALVPAAFTWFRPLIVPALGVIMLGMGLTLTPADFRRVARRWPAVGVGLFAQLGIMPLAALALGRALDLSPELQLGLSLVAACPGGTASNVMAYLAGADVALSISMTAVSTLLSPVATPALLELTVGEAIDLSWTVQAGAILRIIAVPVALGLGARVGLERWGKQRIVTGALTVFPTVSMLFIVAIVACVVGLNVQAGTDFPPQLAAAVVVLNGIGLGAGYGLARLCRLEEAAARAVAIEVGMQNSGLGVALASRFFSPMVALPSAAFSLWHNVSGPVLASWWSRRPTPLEKAATPEA